MKISSAFLALFAMTSLLLSCSDRGGVEDYEFPGGEESGEGAGESPVAGEDEDILQEGYPSSISLYSFTDWFDSDSKCVGWYAIADVSGEGAAAFSVRHFLSPGRTPEGIFSELELDGESPCIVTNAGYFYNGESMSLCIHEGQVESIATQLAYPDGGTAYPVRAAFGMFPDGSFETTWIYCPNDGGQKPYSYPSPLDNDESTGTFMTDMPSTSYEGAELWTPQEAIGGGPMIVLDGKNVANEYYWREVLDAGGTAGMSRQPRTAVGATADGRVIVLVCDGRGMNGSLGYTLSELADKLISLGAEKAINLDGGGSSAIVGKDGKVLNRPSDTGDGVSIVMRQVPTALVITAE